MFNTPSADTYDTYDEQIDAIMSSDKLAYWELITEDWIDAADHTRESGTSHYEMWNSSGAHKSSLFAFLPQGCVGGQCASTIEHMYSGEIEEEGSTAIKDIRDAIMLGSTPLPDMQSNRFQTPDGDSGFDSAAQLMADTIRRQDQRHDFKFTLGELKEFARRQRIARIEYNA